MCFRKHFYILLLFCIHLLYASTPQLEIKNNVNSYTDFTISYFEESSEIPLSIDDVIRSDFHFTSANSFAFGYNNKPLWISFELYNNSPDTQEVILELTEMFHRTVDFYAISSSSMIHEKNGLSIPFHDRKISNINPALPLTLKSYEKQQIYIKLESSYPLFGAVHVKTPEKYYKDTQLKNYILLFYFGAITIIAFYNLFIYFYLKDKIYLYYVSYVLLFTIWVTLYKGFISYFVDEKTFNIIQLTLPGFFIMLIAFSQSLLSTKEHVPRIHRMLNMFIVLLIISALWLLVEFQDGFYFVNILVIPILLLLLISSIAIGLKGSKVAKLYFIVLYIYFIGISLVSLLGLNIIPYHKYIVNLPLIGSFIEIILFSLLLAYRISMLRESTLKYQNQILEYESTESMRLSKMVSEKTFELEVLNAKLETELEEKTKLEKILKQQASTDSLTGIMNRRSFFDACDHEIKLSKRYDHPLSLLIIDIDYFKNINDTYGHLNGDIVLKDVVKIMENTIRDTDILGRIGGEEFAILMPVTSLADSTQLGERIRCNVADHQSYIDNQRVNMTVSIGQSTLLKSDLKIQSLLRRADLALFKAKEGGRNQICCFNKD